ncbi:MAG: hypothetical protein MI975_00530 [Cytophagales bacterium]|nr:hypothetical protein [Cytophagales bacterium]
MEEPERIHFLINNPSEAVQDDIAILDREIERFPYAQYLRVLCAKIKFHINAEDKSVYLTKAAVYSSDRSSLKKVIQESGYLESIEEVVPYQDLASVDFEETTDILAHEGENESATIFDEVLKNLEKLKSLRRQFQFLELNDSPEKPLEDPPVKERKRDKKPDSGKKNSKTDKKPDSEEQKKIDSKKKKLNDILEKDEMLDSQVNVFFLKEIEEKKGSLAEGNSKKQREQKDIIEKFIEEQPSIGSIQKEIERSQGEINRDLSEKSTKFGDDLVSENLAIILLKQGKKDRAVDIYKRLIWKLPQKKAYFAARIEEIKK